MHETYRVNDTVDNMQDKMCTEALRLLSADKRQNALLIGRIEHGFARDVGICGGSIRLLDVMSGNYMFSAEDIETFDNLYNSAETRPQIFFLSGDSLCCQMESRGFEVDMLQQWLIDRDAEMVPADPDFRFGATMLSDLDIVMSVYKSKEFDREYVADIIRDNLSVSAYCGDELAGFVLSHKDGEAGPMVIMEKYRRRGLGGQLLRRITNMMRSAGYNPVCHIHKTNGISQAMHATVGYRPCTEPVLWVYPGGMQ